MEARVAEVTDLQSELIEAWGTESPDGAEQIKIRGLIDAIDDHVRAQVAILPKVQQEAGIIARVMKSYLLPRAEHDVVPLPLKKVQPSLIRRRVAAEESSFQSHVVVIRTTMEDDLRSLTDMMEGPVAFGRSWSPKLRCPMMLSAQRSSGRLPCGGSGRWRSWPRLPRTRTRLAERCSRKCRQS